MTTNLDELHSTNPKEFWKLLNKGKRKNQPDIGIEISSFVIGKLIWLLICSNVPSSISS
jgi:hypothetical protein